MNNRADDARHLDQQTQVAVTMRVFRVSYLNALAIVEARAFTVAQTRARLATNRARLSKRARLAKFARLTNRPVSFFARRSI